MRPVLAIRPEPGLAATLAAGRAAGLEMIGAPLFAIRPRAWTPPPARGFDALLIGSANALRHAGPGLAAFAHLPVLAVGEATAAHARAAGFTIGAQGAGGLQAVLDSLRGAAGPRHLLRLAGEEHVALAAPPQVRIETRIVYAAEPQPLEPDAAAAIAGGAVVLLHSAAAARQFASECDRLALPRARLALAALGPRVLEAAGIGWAALACAAQPAEPALLALARDLCQ